MEREDIERLQSVEDRSKSNTKRLDALEPKVEDIHNLTISVKELATETRLMREDMNKMDKRVIAIEERPNKRMDQIIGYILSALIGGLIGYVLLKLGLK